jgi:hypothetical protein
MKVKLKNKDGDETLLEIIHTIPNKDQFIFEFQARRKETDEIIDFVMVGKEWRRMVTETPHWMNFEK